MLPRNWIFRHLVFSMTNRQSSEDFFKLRLFHFGALSSPLQEVNRVILVYRGNSER